ncbi:hypothetical protein [Streptomyces sp. NPDC058653]|uniref:DUF7715 family protein n=1 Tax=Streptomyces sp. NPDC058653 TaxID=3346576 RepID=UPI00365A475B
MKLLAATSDTQGQRDNDFGFCINGELVIVGIIVCIKDEEDPDGGCGCGRSFLGLNSGKATTTAVVKDIDLTPEDAAEAVRSSLENANFMQFVSNEDLDDIVQDALRIAEAFPVGAVIERRLDVIRQRV